MARNVNFGTQQYFGFDPRTIPNCDIWNDAATLSTLANGTTVGSWSNSASSRTISCTGTVSNAALNTRTVVNFTTAQTWTTVPVINMSAYSLFVVSRQTAGTNLRVLQSTTNNQLFGYWSGYKRAIYIDANPNQLTTALSDTQWDLMSHTRTAGGPFIFNWNGTTLFSSTSSAGTNLTGLAINTGGFPGEVSTCQIAELLLYSAVLTTAEVQQVEGYLAHKWGLQGNLPVPFPLHPFRLFPPAMRIFQPTDIPGCTLWLDGADSDVVLRTAGTSNVTQWRDKSGNSSHTTATGGTSTFISNAINGLSAVSMNTTWLTGSFPAAFTGTQLQAFAVATMTVNAGSFGRILSLGRPGVNDYDSTTTTFMFIRAGGGQSIMVGRNSSYLTIDIPAFNTPFLVQSRHDGAIESIGLNGTLTPATQNTGVGSGFNITSYGIGTNTNTADTQYWNGFIGEVIYYTGFLSSSQRQQVEGYLARKWGIPYSTPSDSIGSPMSVAGGPAVWLDAADSSTITLSGTSNVTQWRDKSATALAMNQLTLANMPTQVSGILSSNVISFTPSQSLTSITNLSLAPTQSIFVVFNPLTTTNYFFLEHGPNVNSTDGSFLYGANADIFAIRRTSQRFVFDALVGRGTVPFRPNNWYYCSLINSNLSTATSDVYWAINGLQRTVGFNTVSNTLTGTATNQLFLNNNGRVPATNYYAEIIIYNSALTLTQARQVEGYLAAKWGLQSLLPLAHPFRILPPSTPLFNPLQLPGCLTWMDAADTALIIGTTQVTSWANKGTGGTNAVTRVGSCSSGNLFNGLNFIRCPAGNSLQITQTPNTQAQSWFVVARLNTVFVSGQFAAPMVGGSGQGSTGIGMTFASSTETFAAIGPSGITNNVGGNAPAALFNAVHILSIVNDLAADRNAMTVNGTSRPLTFSVGAANYRTASTLFLLTVELHNTSMDLMEICFYQRAVSASERQQVEGYLAWKWGLQTLLPVTHNYYRFRP